MNAFSLQVIFLTILPFITQIPNNSNFLWFPLEVRVILSGVNCSFWKPFDGFCFTGPIIFLRGGVASMNWKPTTSGNSCNTWKMCGHLLSSFSLCLVQISISLGSILWMNWRPHELKHFGAKNKTAQKFNIRW